MTSNPPTKPTGKPLPHNLALEASVLGGILLRNEVLLELERLEVDDFYDRRHRVVFQAMRALEARGVVIDIVTLENEIERAGFLEAIGGVGLLGELALRVPTADNVSTYAATVVDLSTHRKAILLAADWVERLRAIDGEQDSNEVLADLLGAFGALERRREQDSRNIAELAHARIEQLEQVVIDRMEGRIAMTGATTGIAELDETLGGYPLGVISLLGARPGMGKSASAQACAAANAEQGHGAHAFTMEDSWMSYADRALARISGVSAQRIRQGDLSRHDIAKLLEAQAALRVIAQRWEVDDRGDLSAHDVVRAVRRARKRLNTRVVIVDYVHLVKREERKGMTEHEALDRIMAVFAAAAKADDLAYLVLAQLNRKLEERVDKRPILSDFRGSGGLEEKAKVVIGQYRGAVYGAPVRDVDWSCDCPAQVRRCFHTPSDEEHAARVQMLLLKNNNGASGVRRWAHWDGPTTTIS